MRKHNRFLAAFLALAMLFSFVPASLAAEEFDLYSKSEELLADQDTKFITLLTQDETTGLITATIQVQNNRTKDNKALVLLGFGTQLTFDSRVSPATPDGGKVYQGGLMTSPADFAEYITMDKDTSASKQHIRNDEDGRFIGAYFVRSDSKKIMIPAGESATLAQYYFMPNEEGQKLDIDMFSYKVLIVDRFTSLLQYLANGATYFSSGDTLTGVNSVIKIYPEAFKVHVRRPAPAVSANNDTRLISGFDANTMEWAYSAEGPYDSNQPLGGFESNAKIYVRTKGDTVYTGNDSVYGAYKMYVPSSPIELLFGEIFDINAKASVTKIGENITSEDDITRVGDIIKYTISVKNTGDTGSVWSNVVVTDQIPTGVTLDESSVGVTGLSSHSYDGDSKILTVQLGDIPAGTERTITFNVTVNDEAYGLSIKNAFSVTGKNGTDEGAEDLNADGSEDGSWTIGLRQSDKPAINQVYVGDETVTGTGVPFASIEVTFPDDSTATVEVDEDGNWSVPVSIELAELDEITAVQTESGKAPSEQAVCIVLEPDAPDAGLSAGKASEVVGAVDEFVRPGNTLLYTITVANTGPEGSMLTDVEIVDALSESVTYVQNSVEIDGEPASATYEEGVLTISVGSIAGGATKKITFKVTVKEDAAEGTVIKNSATVTAKNGSDGEELTEEVDDGDGKTVAPALPPKADMVAEKTSENLAKREDETNRVGDTLRYHFTIKNTGEVGSVLKDVVITDVIPEGVSYVRGSVMIDDLPAGGKVNFENGVLTINAGDIAGKATRNVYFDVIIDAGTEGKTIKNTATITAKDGNTDDDFEETVTDGEGKDILEPAYIHGEKASENLSRDDGTTRVGDLLEYTITISNVGPATILDTIVTDTLPSSVTFVNDDGEEEGEETAKRNGVKIDGQFAELDTDYTFENGTLIVTLGEMAPETTIVITFWATVNEGTEGLQIKNGATVSGTTEGDEPVKEEFEEPDGGRVVENPFAPEGEKKSENLTSTDDKNRVGDKLLYTITLRNTADASVWRGIILGDKLNEFVSFVDGSVAVAIDGEAVEEPVYRYTAETKALRIEVGDIRGPEGEAVITFEVIILDGAQGEIIKNVATVSGLEEDIEEEDGRKIEESLKSEMPTIDPIAPGATTVSGTGVPGAEIVVTFPKGETETAEVGEDGTWTVAVPDGVTLVLGNEVTAVQTEPEKDPSDPAKAIVGGRPIIVSFDTQVSSVTNPADIKVYFGYTYGTLPSPIRSGYTLQWRTMPDGGTVVSSSTEVTKAEDHTLYAYWTPTGTNPPYIPDPGPTIIDPEIPLDPGPILDKENHIKYISGYPDGTVGPDKPITRAEAAQIFYMLIIDSNKGAAQTSKFSDVGAAWYAQAVNYLASKGIISGYEDGSFKPNQPITRAEFATMASKFDKLSETTENAFSDVGSHWAKSYINSAATKGWVSGYSDGTFKPQQNITRAEVVSFVNKMLERKIKVEDIPDSIIKFTDITTGHWAYADIVEASNPHNYTKNSEGFETWVD